MTTAIPTASISPALTRTIPIELHSTMPIILDPIDDLDAPS
jgi:hypothetical protein